MKVLWLNNIMTTVIAEHLKLNKGVNEGWIEGMLGEIVNHDIDVILVFPQRNEKHIIKGCVNGIGYYGYYEKVNRQAYDSTLKETFETIIRESNPDVIHVMGTEFPHSLSMIEAAENMGMIENTVVSIQGLVSIYKNHWFAGIPENVYKKPTIRDIIKRDTVMKQYREFEKRGKYEVLALKKCKHVIGRTDWDFACTTQINPEVQYHFNNENLRDAFYMYQWRIDSCEKHTIFVSQCIKTIKGFGYMLDALKILIKKYPDVKLFAAGSGGLKKKLESPKWKLTSMERFILEKIERSNLQEHVEFLGTLNALKMVERYQKANVFVSPSIIENSPNSVGEAMILGVPTVSSDVGGVKNLLTHESDGYIYQYDAPYMLAYYISKIFDDDDLAIKLSSSARSHALVNHDRRINAEDLVNIYREVRINK